MAWFKGNLQSSLDSLRSQVANSLKDVFVEDEEQVDGRLSEAAAAEQPEDRGSPSTAADTLLESLAKENRDLQRLRQVEVGQLKDLLKDKEEEVQILERLVAGLRQGNGSLEDASIGSQAEDGPATSSSPGDDPGQIQALQELKQSKEALETCHERIAELETKLNTVLEDSQDSKAGYKAQLDELKNDKSTLENECSELQEKLETLLVDLANLKEANQGLGGEGAQESKRRLEQRLREVEAENEVVKRDLTEMETRCQARDAEISQVALELEISNESVRRSEDDMSRMESSLAELESTLRSETSKRDELSEKLLGAEEARKALDSDLANLAEASKEREAEVQRLDVQVQALQDQADQARRECEQLLAKEAKYKEESMVYKVKYEQGLQDLEGLQLRLEEREKSQTASDEEHRICEEKCASLTLELERCHQEAIEAKATQSSLEEFLRLERSNVAELRAASRLDEGAEGSQKYQDQGEGLQRQLDSLSQRLLDETRLKDELIADKEKLNCRVEELKAELQGQADRYRAHQEKYESDLEESRALQGTLSCQLKELKEQRAGEMLDLQSRLEELERLHRVDQETLETRAADLLKLNQEKAGLFSQVEELKKLMANDQNRQQEELDRLVKAKDDLSLRLEHQDKLRADGEAELDARKAEIIELRRQLEDLERLRGGDHEELCLKAERISRLEDEKGQQRAKLGELEAQMLRFDEVTADNERLHSALKEMRELNELKADEELRRSAEQIGALNRQLEELRRATSSLRDEVDSFQGLKADHEQLGLRAEQAMQKNQEYEEKIRALGQALQEERSKVSELEKVSAEKQRLAESASADRQAEAEKMRMVEVLNEKSRENSNLKKENHQLRQMVAGEGAKNASLQKDLAEKGELSKTTVHKLSQLIRDKDVEIEALKSRNESLVSLVQQGVDKGGRDQDDMYRQTDDFRLQEKFDQMALEHADLKAELELMRSRNHRVHDDHEDGGDDRSTVASTLGESLDNVPGDNVPELLEQVQLLEHSLGVVRSPVKKVAGSRISGSQRLRSCSWSHDRNATVLANGDWLGHGNGEKAVDQVSSSSSKDFAHQMAPLEEELLAFNRKLSFKQEEVIRCQEELKSARRKIDLTEARLDEERESSSFLKAEAERAQNCIKALSEEKQSLLSQVDRLNMKTEEESRNLAMARKNLDQLQLLLNEASNRSEESQKLERQQSLSAIRDLQQLVSKLTKERDEARLVLAGRDREMGTLRSEINNVIDKKKRLEQELERLKEHLVGVEETYTQEAVEAEDRERELRSKVQSVEEKLRVANAMQNTNSKAATAHSQNLEAKVSDLTRENEQMRMRLFSAETEFLSQKKAMENLNLALEGFHHEKVNDMKRIESSYRARLEEERAKQAAMENDLQLLVQQVNNANEGLAAANRLGDQLDLKTKIIVNLKQEIKLREDLLRQAQRELEESSSKNTGKVDRDLVKNLVVGFAVADDSKKAEILKVVATVLDFNQEERSRTGLDQGGGSWLRGWFGGASPSSRTSGTTPGEIQAATGLDVGLAQAFVNFLQEESKPQGPPLKLPALMTTPPERNPVAARGGSWSGQRSSANSTPSSQVSGLYLTNSGEETAWSSSSAAASNNPLLRDSSGAQTVLPTFAVNRSSSSILKTVLRDDEVVTSPDAGS